ncbi:MAG: hypothetical protein ACFFGZ_02850 [Candidatus Thorarchaeota archaeon]
MEKDYGIEELGSSGLVIEYEKRCGGSGKDEKIQTTGYLLSSPDYSDCAAARDHRLRSGLRTAGPLLQDHHARPHE